MRKTIRRGSGCACVSSVRLVNDGTPQPLLRHDDARVGGVRHRERRSSGTTAAAISPVICLVQMAGLLFVAHSSCAWRTNTKWLKFRLIS